MSMETHHSPYEHVHKMVHSPDFDQFLEVPVGDSYIWYTS